MKEFFKELFTYNFSMNEKLIEKFNELPTLSQKKASLFSHILSAHHIWNHRIVNEKTHLSVWGDIPNTAYQKINTDNYHISLKILEQHDLESNIEYVNSKGDAFTNSIKDILFHVVNHSNYHRAQIATEMKASGFTPIISDYIFYKR